MAGRNFGPTGCSRLWSGYFPSSAFTCAKYAVSSSYSTTNFEAYSSYWISYANSMVFNFQGVLDFLYFRVVIAFHTRGPSWKISSSCRSVGCSFTWLRPANGPNFHQSYQLLNFNALFYGEMCLGHFQVLIITIFVSRRINAKFLSNLNP